MEAKHGTKYPTYVATQYKTQTVAGTNYFVKVTVVALPVHAESCSCVLLAWITLVFPWLRPMSVHVGAGVVV